MERRDFVGKLGVGAVGLSMSPAVVFSRGVGGCPVEFGSWAKLERPYVELPLEEQERWLDGFRRHMEVTLEEHGLRPEDGVFQVIHGDWPWREVPRSPWLAWRWVRREES